jgi:anti-sigma B factor antagonist
VNGVDPTRPTLRLRGDVDMLSADSIRYEGQQLLSAAPSGASLAIDLNDVTFLDSAGLSAFVQLRLAATAGGGDVILLNVPNRVVKLLRVSGLADLFPIE